MNRVNIFNILDYSVKAQEYFKSGATDNSSYDNYRPFIDGDPEITTACGTKIYNNSKIMFLYDGAFIDIESAIFEIKSKRSFGYSEEVVCNMVLSQMVIVDKVFNKMTFIDVDSIIDISFT